MNKYLFYLLILFFLPVCSFAGPSVIGTRFFFSPETRGINVKVINDDESDYLIKTSVNNNDFIISPPLFILPKNTSNIITIIPGDSLKQNKDEIYKLVITAIPKSEKNSINNIVSLATRSHFNIIYQHKKNDNDDFNKIILTKNSNGKYQLENNSDNVFYIELSTNEDFKSNKRKLLSTNDNLEVKECKSNEKCHVWIKVLAGNDAIIKKIYLSSDR
ncbi:fimbria/pilus periplasmic chaperone [Moellerella wisconsensis]|uniref:fimbrial biogenesis chaperone n=1 Tax=Moellerella wisconsensis TaxID=158849 RepID=UPI0030761F8B